jgi:hypothetical protein
MMSMIRQRPFLSNGRVAELGGQCGMVLGALKGFPDLLNSQIRRKIQGVALGV